MVTYEICLGQIISLVREIFFMRLSCLSGKTGNLSEINTKRKEKERRNKYEPKKPGDL
jgi:hypothetical protein